MIYKLRRKFIGISAISVVVVLSVVFSVAAFSSVKQLNDSIDTLADAISSNGGNFPEYSDFERKRPPDDRIPNKRFDMPNSKFMTPESKFSTRFFIVEFDESGNILHNDIKQIVSVTEDEAERYAQKAMKSSSQRGWISDFRYKKYETKSSKSVVFVDGSINKNMTLLHISSLAGVLAATVFVIVILLVLISKKATKPIAESYEKQRRFITDASHELKTPLTLIMANLDIIESENGKSEWIDDIRTEGENMSELVKHLVNLSRMDEENSGLMNITTFSLSDICTGSFEKFRPLAEEKSIDMVSNIAPDVEYCGDEKMICRLISILLDNAVKYCDTDGKIGLSLESGKQPVVEITNSYSDIDNLELERLCERFYRADKARTSGSGYGIGLSLAESIVKAHKSRIKIYKAGENKIGFKIVLHNLSGK